MPETCGDIDGLGQPFACPTNAILADAASLELSAEACCACPDQYVAAPEGLAGGCEPDLSNFDRGVDELVTRVQVKAELSLEFADVAVPRAAKRARPRMRLVLRGSRKASGM